MASGRAGVASAEDARFQFQDRLAHLGADPVRGGQRLLMRSVSGGNGGLDGGALNEAGDEIGMLAGITLAELGVDGLNGVGEMAGGGAVGHCGLLSLSGARDRAALLFVCPRTAQSARPATQTCAIARSSPIMIVGKSASHISSARPARCAMAGVEPRSSATRSASIPGAIVPMRWPICSVCADPAVPSHKSCAGCSAVPVNCPIS